MDLSQQLADLSDKQGTLLKSMEDVTAAMESGEKDRAEGKAQMKVLADEMAEITKTREDAALKADVEAQREAIKALTEQTRTPSKASAISAMRPQSKGSDDEYFMWATWAAHNTRFPEFHEEGKALLAGMDTSYQYGDGKATLGDTAVAGGNVVPPNVIAQYVTLRTATNIYRNLLNVVDAGFVTGVDVPAESLVPLALTVQAYGATKTNINLTLAKYTATMYTIAAIYDVGNQLLRNSRGAIESLVRSRLTRALALGEAFYILNGTGTSQPKGILTSIGTSGTFVTSFTASSTTLAGSSAAAIAKATGVLANRARQPDGVVVNASDFWIMAAQGTDTAGFFFNPAGGPTQINPTIGMLRIWGLPVYADPNMPTDSMVVGEWGSASMFTGQSYRVDVTDTAGTRWDTNETGFRGEEEIGFNADPYVVSGLFQRVTDFTP